MGQNPYLMIPHLLDFVKSFCYTRRVEMEVAWLMDMGEPDQIRDPNGS